VIDRYCTERGQQKQFVDEMRAAFKSMRKSHLTFEAEHE
jgi:hypothetical protein